MILLSLGGCSTIRVDTVDYKVDCTKKNKMLCTGDGDECCDQPTDPNFDIIIDF